MMHTADKTKRRLRTPLGWMALLCGWLVVASPVAAGPFFDEMTADHRGHDHADETNQDGLVDGIDATCLPGPPVVCADFSRTNFAGTQFFDSDFTAVLLTDVILSFTEITNSIFATGTLAGANFDDAYIERVDFSDADLSMASFRRATVRGSIFDRADVSGSDFTDSQFRCILDPDVDANDDPEALCPSFVQTDFTNTDLTSTLFAPQFTGEELVFSGANFQNATLRDMVFAAMIEPCFQTDAAMNLWSCLVFGGTGNTSVIDGISILNDSDLRGSDWSELTISDSVLPGALIAGASFEGSTFVDSELQQVVADCTVDNDDPNEDDLCDFLQDPTEIRVITNFRDTSFTRVSFEGAELDHSTFVDGADGDSDGAIFTEVDFSDARFFGSDFTDAVLTDVVFDRLRHDCDLTPNDFADDCDKCPIFTGALDGQVAPADGEEFNISMQNVDWDGIFACSAQRVSEGGAATIDDLSFMRLDNGSFRDVDVTSVDFEGSSLVAVNLREATITGVNFDGADLTGGRLDETVSPCVSPGVGCATFVGTTLAQVNLSDTNFAGANFDDAVLDGAVGVDTDFTGASFGDDDANGDGPSGKEVIFSASILDAATFTDADLTGMQATCLTANGETVCASFQGTTFTNSDLTGARLTGADLRGATFPGSNLTNANLAEADLDGTTSLSGVQIDGLDLDGVDFSDVSPSLFQGKLDFVPDVAEGEDSSDAVGVNLAAADVTGFDFSGLELINWNFEGATLTNAVFSGAALSGSSFRNIQFDDVFGTLTVDSDFFAGMDLQGADLRRLDLTGFDLSNANLTGVTVRTTLFVNADLSGAKLVNLDRICDNGEDCAEFTGALLSCADLDQTNYGNFAVRDGMAALVPNATDLFQFTDPDLSGIKLVADDLRGYEFSGLDLAGADLSGSDLRTADLSGADLSGTGLANTTICTASTTTPECSDFSGASLSSDPDCDLQLAADLSGVNFLYAPSTLFDAMTDGSCVDFTNANLSRPSDASARGFDFSRFDALAGAVLAGAQLRFQDFTGEPTDFFQGFAHAPESRDDICTAEDDDIDPIDPTPDLRASDFGCADISGKNFADTDLRDARFVNASVGGAGFDFANAELRGSDFADVDFSDDALVDVFQPIATVRLDEDDPDSDEVVDENEIPYPNLRGVSFAFADLESDTLAFNLNHVDLSGANLDGANLNGADLRDAILDAPASLCGVRDISFLDPDSCPGATDEDTERCVSLDGAMLEGASFRNTNFFELFDDDRPNAADFFQGAAGANLGGVNFFGSNIARLNLGGLFFRDAGFFINTTYCNSSSDCVDFADATFESTDLEVPLNLRNIDFRESNFAGANFVNVDLSGSDLSDVGDLCSDDAMPDCLSITGVDSSLQGTDLRDLDLTQVDFGTVGVDGITDFRAVNFRRGTLSGIDLSGRDLTGANFRATDAAGANFSSNGMGIDGAILASIITGCEEISGDSVCANFDNTTLCGVDARNAILEGSFDGLDAYPPGCSEAADFSGATFDDSSLATMNLSNANLEGARFDDSVDFCNSAGSCLTLVNARLVGVDFSGIDFDEVPDIYFRVIADRDLSESDLSNTDLSGKILRDTDFSFANLSEADLRNTDLSGSVFEDTEFATGGVSASGDCELGPGGSRVDLRGADLSSADFSRAKNFQRGCIRVNSSTIYNYATKFPPGFDLFDVITIPEPSRGLLQAAALSALGWLLRRRRLAA